MTTTVAVNETLRIVDFFSVRSIFISPNEHKSSIFASGEATSENSAFGVHSPVKLAIFSLNQKQIATKGFFAFLLRTSIPI